MGSDARIYIFDHNKYTTEVIPALKSFLLTGHLNPWLSELKHKIDTVWYVPEYLCSSSIDIDKYCNYLEADFSARNQYSLFSGIDWELRSCKSPSCLLRDFCIFHTSSGRDNVKYFNCLICGAIIEKTLGRSQFVGRSQRASWYQEDLHFNNLRLIKLLSALAYRGNVIGYLWKNSDGIYGWLSPSETCQLYQELSKIDLPLLDRSFDAMEEALREFRSERNPEPSRLNFCKLSLSFVRTVAQIAYEQDCGILWGNDLPHYFVDENA